MRIRPLALLALSGLLAGVFAYAVPALADDASTDNQSAQQSAPAGTDMQNQNADNGSDNNSDNNDDAGEPDVPSGDDDY